MGKQTFFLTEDESTKLVRRLKKRHNRSPLDIAKTLDGDGARKCGFLSAFAECGNISLAARTVAVSNKQVKRWRKNDQAFKRLYAEAEEYSIAMLEQEARRRAFNGVKKRVLYKGEPVMVSEDPNDPDSELVPLFEVSYSDDLMKLLLKAHKPEKYRENVDVTSKGETISYKQEKRLKGVSVDDL